MKAKPTNREKAMWVSAETHKNLTILKAKWDVKTYDSLLQMLIIKVGVEL